MSELESEFARLQEAMRDFADRRSRDHDLDQEISA